MLNFWHASNILENRQNQSMDGLIWCWQSLNEACISALPPVD
jgi:hypothetical protein